MNVTLVRLFLFMIVFPYLDFTKNWTSQRPVLSALVSEG